MAGKLTEDQKAEIVQRYLGGESSERLGPEFGITPNGVLKMLAARGVVRRVASRPKLCEQQWRELEQEYRAGRSSTELSRAYGVSTTLVCNRLRSLGLTRAPIQAAAVRYDNEAIAEVGQMSQAALFQAYAGLGSGYPSVGTLAVRFGVGPRCMRNRLGAAGIKVRSQRDQERIDVVMGHRNWLDNKGHGHRWTSDELRSLVKGRPKSAEHKRRLSDAKKKSIFLPCEWCGSQIERCPSTLAKAQRHFCDVGCRNRFLGHWRRWGDEAPRPLIVEKLRGMLSEERWRALPRTYDTLEKMGSLLGARDLEIMVILADSGV